MVANGVLGRAKGERNGVPLGLFCTELRGDPESEVSARCNLGRWLKDAFCDIAQCASATSIPVRCTDLFVVEIQGVVFGSRWMVEGKKLAYTLMEVFRALSETGVAAFAMAVTGYLSYERISRGRRNHYA